MAQFYCTPEGGSGFVTSAQSPVLSTFEMPQLSPVYDQGPGWLRNTDPGSFTNYPRFGPPYSLDGGTQPPFDGAVDVAPGSVANPIPYQVGCGMGAFGPTPNRTRDDGLILLRSDVVAPMPSITTTARSGCVMPASSCPSALESWIENNPWIAVGVALAAGYLIWGNK